MNQRVIFSLLAIIILLVLGFVILRERQSPAPSTEEFNFQPITPTQPPGTTLKIEDLRIGTGSAVKEGDIVVINYEGRLSSGQVFDSSYARNAPFETEIGVGRVIEGWDKGLLGMKIGGKRKLTIPPNLGYGSRGVPNVIPPNSTLIFEVELLDVKSPEISPTEEPVTPSPTPEE
ncbi:MAG: Peptidyl-prolyl cis-trans isomerase [Candidatus Levybacteria bacterium GW2011_GWA2_40_8]|nr:MAG: Peptidyl-prolyl cis-trans isomerase [Candidatus Levybacteria bacterium GW2011_GWA2_40_8]